MSKFFYRLCAVIFLSAILIHERVFAEAVTVESTEAGFFDSISETFSTLMDMFGSLVNSIGSMSLSLSSIATSILSISHSMMQMASSLSVIAFFFMILTCFVCLYITIKIIIIIAPLVKFTVLFIYKKLKGLFMYIFGKKKEETGNEELSTKDAADNKQVETVS